MESKIGLGHTLFEQHVSLSSLTFISSSEQTHGINPILFNFWASVEDGQSLLKQRSMNASCFLG